MSILFESQVFYLLFYLFIMFSLDFFSIKLYNLFIFYYLLLFICAFENNYYKCVHLSIITTHILYAIYRMHALFLFITVQIEYIAQQSVLIHKIKYS
jgi:hypothetical protein